MAEGDQIICNGIAITLPSLEVVKTIPKMAAGANIDWLLHIYYTRRDFKRCKEIIERELYRHLNPEYLYFIKGLIDREEGNNAEALRNLQKAIDLNTKNIETYKEIGKTLYMMGRFNQALGVFRDAEELSPRPDHEVFHFIAELLQRSAAARTTVEEAQKDRADAKAYFQKAVQCGKKLESFQKLAEIYRKEKEYGKAIEVLESGLLMSPENTEILTEIGVLYLKINDTQKAYDRLLEVINADKTNPKGLLAFGAILQSRNEVDAALEKYNELAELQPDIPELWNNIGLCFFKKQKNIMAISTLRKALWFSPLNYNVLYNLSLVYISAQQYASAFHTLAAAINLRKDSADCYMLLGICLRKLEDPENAYTAFERSSEIAVQQQNGKSRNPLIHLNFALFCYEIGRLALSTEQYQIFLNVSQDMLLPTEYKFQATKLKSLLKISNRSNLLINPQIAAVASATNINNFVVSEEAATTPTEPLGDKTFIQQQRKSNNDYSESNYGNSHPNSEFEKLYGANDMAQMTNVTTTTVQQTSTPAATITSTTTTTTVSLMRKEIPVEVNAVVNEVRDNMS